MGGIDMAQKTKKEITKQYDDDALQLLGIDGGGEKPKPKKPVFYFKEIGLVIPIWGVLTLEKSIDWSSVPQTHAVYGIVINRGMEPSQSCPVGEKAMWYEKEEVRDQRYEEMISMMNETNFKVITL